MTARQTRGRAAFKTGLWAETVAAWLLRLKGYAIIGQRVRTAAGEIDLIARRGSTLVFVEVKARRSEDLAAQAIHPRQRHRIERAAQAWCAHRPWTADLTLRFDAVVMGRGRPRHIADAWRPTV